MPVMYPAEQHMNNYTTDGGVSAESLISLKWFNSCEQINGFLGTFHETNFVNHKQFHSFNLTRVKAAKHSTSHQLVRQVFIVHLSGTIYAFKEDIFIEEKDF